MLREARHARAGIVLEQLEQLAVDGIGGHALKIPCRPAYAVEMRVLFVGDVFSQSGVKAATKFLTETGDEYDFIIVNGENSAPNGRGITRKAFAALRKAGADVITLGNHSFDHADGLVLVEETNRIIRPHNYPVQAPGLGFTAQTARNGTPVGVVQLLGQVFTEPVNDPFAALDDALEQLPGDIPVIVDMHAEATSEKKVMMYHATGRASAVIGTHTHVPTADAMVVGGTAYITDVGMCGVLHSAIGLGFPEMHERFLTKRRPWGKPAEGPVTVHAVAIDLDGTRATAITPIAWQAPTV